MVIPCSSETLKILKNYYITNAYVKPIKPKYCIVESESIIELLLMKLNKKISNNYLLYTTLMLLWIFQNIFIALLKLVKLYIYLICFCLKATTCNIIELGYYCEEYINSKPKMGHLQFMN